MPMAKYRDDEYFWSSASMSSINEVTRLVTNDLTYRGCAPREKVRSGAFESQQPALSRSTSRRSARKKLVLLDRKEHSVSDKR